MTESRQRKKRKPVTYQMVERMAVHYLQRFPASRSRYKSIMRQKLKRYEHPTPPNDAQLAEWVQAAEAFCLRVGLLDDQALSNALARSYHRRGNSIRTVKAKLRRKGFDADTIQTAVEQFLTQFEGRVDDADLIAALRYLRKRRFGPFHPRELDWTQRRKQMAALARRQLSFDVCQRAMNMALEEAQTVLYEADYKT
ncbi:MAG: regulatory protein RecX [Myxococcota bacterium]|nr:regulatory protein RecX [Myxococcota bacterium]